uniref:Thaumatin, pathogenesis-related n=1 Tax=Medicago truncatula TaxID=3880 RepID=A2Q3N8_MEDTR|nr:Thaumatin, pathogenesis-related [Medicago truncatula]
MYACANSATFTITNNCFELPSKTSSTLNNQSPWSSRFQVRTQRSTNTTGKFICATGDRGSGQIPCNGAGGIPPVSLVEFTLSLIDGFNLPVSVTSQGGSGDCKTSSCTNDVNRVCPPNFAGGSCHCLQECLFGFVPARVLLAFT